MLDLVLTGGSVVTPAGPVDLAIGVKDGKIASLTDSAAPLPAAARTLKADGMVVVPGGIDPHVHCNMELADPSGGRSTYTAGPDIVSRAALHGGTTTLIDFAWHAPAETLRTTIERRLKDWQSNAYTDYSLHLVLRGEISEALLQEIPQVIADGFVSFKVFTSDVTPGDDPIKVPFGSIWELFKVTAANSGVVAVHAEDDDLVMHMYRKLFREGRVGFEHMPEVHSALSEGLSFRRVIGLAASVPGTVVYMMHVSAAAGVQAIAEGRSHGVAVFGETLHQYALHTDAAYHEPDGMKYHTYPSIKSKEDTRALWKGVAHGEIATFATDELCTTYAVKTAGRRIDNVTGGNAGVEPRMAIIFSEVVQRRGMGLNRFVELTSANAAKIMGLYPRKGAIAVGSDADLAVIDPRREVTISAAILHESDYTPWEGWRVGAWPVATVKGGVVVVEGAQFASAAPRGQLIPRRLLADVRRGVP